MSKGFQPTYFMESESDIRIGHQITHASSLQTNTFHCYLSTGQAKGLQGKQNDKHTFISWDNTSNSGSCRKTPVWKIKNAQEKMLRLRRSHLGKTQISSLQCIPPSWQLLGWQRLTRCLCRNGEHLLLRLAAHSPYLSALWLHPETHAIHSGATDVLCAESLRCIG